MYALRPGSMILSPSSVLIRVNFIIAKVAKTPTYNMKKKLVVILLAIVAYNITADSGRVT